MTLLTIHKNYNGKDPGFGSFKGNSDLPGRKPGKH